jgi:hypothetical protein
MRRSAGSVKEQSWRRAHGALCAPWRLSILHQSRWAFLSTRIDDFHDYEDTA